MKLKRLIGLAIILALVSLIVLFSFGYKGWLSRLAHSVPGGDFTGHIGFMGLLGFAANLFISPRLKGSRFRATALVSLGVCIFISLEEASQHFLPTRTFDFSDLFAGIGGVIAAGLVYWRWFSATE